VGDRPNPDAGGRYRCPRATIARSSTKVGRLPARHTSCGASAASIVLRHYFNQARRSCTVSWFGTMDALRLTAKARLKHLMRNQLKYEIAESKDYPGHWHVEAVDNEGLVFVAVFSGPEARDRAAEYADWKNGIRHPTAVLQLVGRQRLSSASPRNR
jgi:hypothetical protein